MFDELVHLPPVFRITVSNWRQGRSRNQAGKNLKHCQVINYVARTHPLATETNDVSNAGTQR